MEHLNGTAVIEEQVSGWDIMDDIMEWEMAQSFGQDTGECGMCGDPLDAAEKETGLCFDHQIELDEQFDRTPGVPDFDPDRTMGYLA